MATVGSSVLGGTAAGAALVAAAPIVAGVALVAGIASLAGIGSKDKAPTLAHGPSNVNDMGLNMDNPGAGYLAGVIKTLNTGVDGAGKKMTAHQLDDMYGGIYAVNGVNAYVAKEIFDSNNPATAQINAVVKGINSSIDGAGKKLTAHERSMWTGLHFTNALKAYNKAASESVQVSSEVKSNAVTLPVGGSTNPPANTSAPVSQAVHASAVSLPVGGTTPMTTNGASSSMTYVLAGVAVILLIVILVFAF